MTSIHDNYVIRIQAEQKLFKLTEARREAALAAELLERLGFSAQVELQSVSLEGETTDVDLRQPETKVVIGRQEADGTILSFKKFVKGALDHVDNSELTVEETVGRRTTTVVNWAAIKLALVDGGKMTADEFKSAVAEFQMTQTLRGISFKNN